MSNRLSFLGLRLFRLFHKLCEKAFLLVVRGSFSKFGAHSSLGLPVTLWRPDLISIGKDVYIGPGSWLQVTQDAISRNGEPILSIMDGVSITGGCFISAKESVVIERNVLMGRFIHISDHSHRFDDLSRPVMDQGITQARPVRICEGSWLGQGVVILPGVTIGRNAIVGANSVVREDIPPFSVAVGAPAKIVHRLGPEAAGKQ